MRLARSITATVLGVWLCLATATAVSTNFYEEVDVPALVKSPAGPPDLVHWRGGAWSDIDNDGDFDFLIAGKADSSDDTVIHWLENVGKGEFKSRSLPISGEPATADGTRHQILSIDFDNDGNQDLYVAGCDYTSTYKALEEEGKDPLSSFPLPCSTPLLLRGSGSGDFTVVENSGISQPTLGSIAATAGDVNGDGLVDLFVGESLPFVINEDFQDDFKSKLYINKGGLSFEDSGIDVHNPGVCAAVMLDLDLDGDQDLVTTSCNVMGAGVSEVGTTRNPGAVKILANKFKDDGALAFEDITETVLGEPVTGHYGGICVVDLNNDGIADMYLGSTAPPAPHRLFISQGDGTWVDEAAKRGIPTTTDVSWGCAFLDANNDGKVDLVTAGALLGAGNAGRVFLNNGKGVFSDAGNLGVGDKDTSGIAVADFDNDLGMDIAVVGQEVATDVSMFRNTKPNGNRLISITLQGDVSNRDAIGARVTMCLFQFGNKVCDGRYVTAGDGFASSNSRQLSFGVSRKSFTLVRIEVVWPSGKTQLFFEFLGKSYVLKERIRNRLE